MPIIESRVNQNSEAFRANREQMLALIGDFRALEQKVRDFSNSKRDRFRARGQLMPRERIALLLDPGAPLLELSTLAGYRMHDDDGARASRVAAASPASATSSGVRCIVSANDSAIKGGTVDADGPCKKHLRIQQIALENKLPFVRLVEFGGANLLYQAEIFVEGGRGFANQARMSAARHSAGHRGARLLDRRRRLPARPLRLRDHGARPRQGLSRRPAAAEGRDRRDRDRRGAGRRGDARHRVRRRRISGRERCRRHPHGARSHRQACLERQAAAAPAKVLQGAALSTDELGGVVPSDYRKPYDVREVIARMVDDSDFLEFKALYDQQTVCGHAEIEGEPVGLIGNNGPIDAEGAVKAAQFIQLCCQAKARRSSTCRTRPATWSAREAERGGIVKHGSKMIQAVANATVPQLTIAIGGSLRRRQLRHVRPRLRSALHLRLAQQPHRGHGRRAGGEASWRSSPRRSSSARARSRSTRPGSTRWKRLSSTQFDGESTALYATAQLWDDGMIDPRDTRRVLAFCLSICREADMRPLKPNTFGVARM